MPAAPSSIHIIKDDLDGYAVAMAYTGPGAPHFWTANGQWEEPVTCIMDPLGGMFYVPSGHAGMISLKSPDGQMSAKVAYQAGPASAPPPEPAQLTQQQHLDLALRTTSATGDGIAVYQTVTSLTVQPDGSIK